MLIFLDFIWNTKTTTLLLSRTKQVWKSSETLRLKKQRDILYRRGALNRKWLNMKKRYCAIKDEIKETGRGSTSWGYYSQMDDILVVDRTANILSHVISTIMSATPARLKQLVRKHLK